VYVDNIYFHNGNTGSDDHTLAPVPAQLRSCWPNPFKPVTTIGYSIEKSAHVSLKIYDLKGRLVDTLVDANLTPNNYQQVWNASGAAAGVYFYRLSINGEAVDTKRMVLLK